MTINHTTFQAHHGSRNVSVTATCLVCDRPLPAGRKRTTCSDACRQALWRKRNQPESTPPALPAAEPRKAHTVYECPDCDARLLGSQFCEDCHTFMRRLGAGGISPCCGEPVTFDELLDS
jgi:hypothetical protein